MTIAQQFRLDESSMLTQKWQAKVSMSNFSFIQICKFNATKFVQFLACILFILCTDLVIATGCSNNSVLPITLLIPQSTRLSAKVNKASHLIQIGSFSLWWPCIFICSFSFFNVSPFLLHFTKPLFFNWCSNYFFCSSNYAT